MGDYGQITQSKIDMMRSGTKSKNIYTNADVLERLVAELKDEINFLRSALLKKSDGK